MCGLMLRVADRVRRMLRSLATVVCSRDRAHDSGMLHLFDSRAAVSTVNASGLSTASGNLVTLDHHSTSGAQIFGSMVPA